MNGFTLRCSVAQCGILLLVCCAAISSAQEVPKVTVSNAAELQAEITKLVDSVQFASRGVALTIVLDPPLLQLSEPLLVPAEVILPQYTEPLGFNLEILGARGAVATLQCVGERPHSAIVSRTYSVYLMSETLVTIRDCRDSALVINAAYMDWSNLTRGSSLYRTTVQNYTFINNTADRGGAIRLERGSMSLVTCVFDGNTARQGGAVYTAGSGTYSSMLNEVAPWSNNVYKGNRAMGGGANESHGGAVYFAQGSCFGEEQYSNYTNNSAEGDGGALYLSGSTCQDEVFKKWMKDACITALGSVKPETYELGRFAGVKFYNNSAGRNGGALFAVQEQEESGTNLVLWDTGELVNNTAGASGGGMFARVGWGLVVSDQGPGVLFRNNRAGHSGGALTVLSHRNAFLELQSARFENNTVSGSQGFDTASSEFVTSSLDSVAAPLLTRTVGGGGAVAVGGPMVLRVNGTRFDGNAAPASGGSLLCSHCNSANVTNSTFTENRAGLAGGGAALVGLTVVSSVRGNITFANNSVDPALWTLQLAPEATAAAGPCVGAGGGGGGGGLCMQSLSPEAEVADIVFSGNSAAFGGGLFLETSSCAQSAFDACPVRMRNISVAGNSATRLGDDLYITSIRRQPLEQFCGCKDGNRIPDSCACDLAPFVRAASGAASLGSRPVALAVTGVAPAPVTSDQRFDVALEAYDAAGQRAVDTDVPLAAGVFAQPGSGVSVRPQQALLEAGGAVVPDVRVFAAVGRYQLLATLRDDIDRLLASAEVPVVVRECTLGEVTVTDGVCRSCTSAEQYSMDPQATQCTTCPASATCSGATIVPDNRYWHSHPRSSQLHRCWTLEACEYPERSTNLTAWQAGVANESSLSAEQVESYLQLQCADGYEGTLCGSCEDSYARQGTTCRQCAQPASAIAGFVGSQLLSLAVIAILVLSKLIAARQRLLRACTAPQMTAPVAAKGASNTQGGQSPSPPPGSSPGGSQYALCPAAYAFYEGSDTPLKDSLEEVPLPYKDGSKDAAVLAAAAPLGSCPHSTSSVPAVATGPRQWMQRVRQWPGWTQWRHWREADQDDLAALIEVLVQYVQTLGLLAAIDLDWPLSVREFLAAINFTASSMRWLVFGCMFPNMTSAKRSYAELLLALIRPIAYMAIASAVLLLVPAAWPGTLGKRRKRTLLVVALSTVALFTYSSTTAGLLAAFACRALDVPQPASAAPALQIADWLHTGLYWTRDFGEACFSATHLVYVAAVAVPGLVLFSLGVPLLLAVLVRKYARRYGSGTAMATPRQLHIALQQSLYSPYRKGRHYFVAGRLLLLLALTVAVEGFAVFGAELQVLLFLAVLVASTLLLAVFPPYCSRLLTRIQLGAAAAAIASAYSAMFVAADTPSSWRVGASIFALVTNGAFLLVMLPALVWVLKPPASKTMQVVRSVSKRSRRAPGKPASGP